MKRFIYLFVIVTIFLSSCKTEQNAARINDQLSNIDAQIDLEKKQNQLAEIQHQRTIDSLRRAQEIIDAKNAQKIPTEIPQDVTLTPYPCLAESIDRAGDYMGGFGIAVEQTDPKDAQNSAIQAAKASIASRFMGVVKNSFILYNKETNTPNRDQVKESELEGIVSETVEKAIDKYAAIACIEFGTHKLGSHNCYVALRIPLQDVVKEVEKAVEKVGLDKAKYISYLQSGLNNDVQNKK